MGATLGTWLAAGTALPASIESKFKMLPRISAPMAKIATMIPAGPAILPNVPAGGLPTPNFSNLPNPPALFSSPLFGRKLPLSPDNPGSARGTLDYGANYVFAGLPLSPANPGAIRGSITYVE